MSVERHRCAVGVCWHVLQDKLFALRTHPELREILVAFPNDVVVLESKASGERSATELQVIAHRNRYIAVRNIGGAVGTWTCAVLWTVD